MRSSARGKGDGGNGVDLVGTFRREQVFRCRRYKKQQKRLLLFIVAFRLDIVFFRLYRYPENPNYSLSNSQRFLVVRQYYMGVRKNSLSFPSGEPNTINKVIPIAKATSKIILTVEISINFDLFSITVSMR